MDKVVACCRHPRQPDDRRAFWRQCREKAAEIGMERLADITVDRWLGDDFRIAHGDLDATLRAMFKRTSLAGYQALVGAFIEMDFTDRLAGMPVPALLTAGEHDHVGGPVEDISAMAAQIPSARFEIFEKPDISSTSKPPNASMLCYPGS